MAQAARAYKRDTNQGFLIALMVGFVVGFMVGLALMTAHPAVKA